MKKQNIFIISICLVVVISYIIIAMFFNKLNKEYYRDKPINSVLGVVLTKTNKNFTIKPMFGEDEYETNDILTINKEIDGIHATDIINITYDDNNVNNFKDYTIYKNHEVKNDYVLYSYKENNDESIIIKTLDQYEKYIKKHDIVDAKEYSESFFEKNSLYINIKKYDDACLSTKILNTYINDTNLIIETDYNENIKCEGKNIIKYFIVEDKKSIAENTKIFVNKNRLEYYESYTTSKNISLYIWKRNNQLFYGLIDTDNVENNLSLIVYLRAMPLTLEEAASIIKLRFNDAAIKIVSNVTLTTDELNQIKKEIGVE